MSAGQIPTRQVTGLDSVLAGMLTPEQVRDLVGTLLVAGANVTITPDDPGDTITIAASFTPPTIELLMQDGVTGPPVPIETEARDDWLYQG